MRRVKNPILLDANLNDQEMLRPTKGSLSLQLCDVSECSLTLPLDSPNVHMHAWIKVFNQNGFVGIFRRTSNNRNIPNDLSTTFRHGIDILQDSIWDDETDFEGTKSEFLTALLNKQTSLIQGPGDSAPRKPWVLGTCEDTSTYKKSIKYNNLLDLFQDLEDEGGDYYFSYNQTVWPWTVSFLHRSSTVASEFRLKRNMEKCRISENDSELCTRLVLQINSMMADSSLDDVKQNKMIARTYNNDAAQAIYGVIVKTEDIDTTDSVPNGPFPDSDAFAAKYLADRAAPLVTVQIDGRELYRQTGDTWDEAQMGTLCRASIPDYDTYIAQRLVGVNYPDLFGVPDRVVLTLSNATPKTLRDKSNLSRSVASAERTAVRAGGGGRSNAREIESFDQHFKIVDDSNKVLKQAGMHLDANGLLVYADDNQNMVGARFNVQADKIGMVVGENQSGNFIKAGEIALSINRTTGESTALIDAAHVNISATSTAHTLAGDIEHDANGRLIIKNAGGMYVRKTISGVTSEFGVFDDNNLTAGVIATKVNGVASTHISGDNIYIGNESATTVIAGKCTLADVTTDVITSRLANATVSNITSLAAGDILCNSFSLKGALQNVFVSDTSGGVIELTLVPVEGSNRTISFNIAATQFYIDGVAAAKRQGITETIASIDVYPDEDVSLGYSDSQNVTVKVTNSSGGTSTVSNFTITSPADRYNAGKEDGKLIGWNAACDYVTRSGNTINGPKKNAYGQNEAKYTAHYSGSSYTAEKDSYTASKLTINGDVKGSGSGTMNGIPWSYTHSSHSHTDSSYSGSSFYWT